MADKTESPRGKQARADMPDVFRPRSEPARTIYDAFQAVAKHRTAGWQWAERLVIYDTAKNYALSHNGMCVPSLRDVLNAEQEGMWTTA